MVLLMVTLVRSRWAAVGAAVAVTLGGGGLIGVSAADTSSTLVPIAPVRVLDTRASDMVGDINDGASITVQITGSIATVSEGTKTVVPSGASAITGNMTLVSTTSNDYGGFATIYPCGTRPDASNINFASGQTVANSVAVPLSASGTVCIYVYGTAHVLLDVAGYYTKSEISDLADRVTAIEQDTTISQVVDRVTAVETYTQPRSVIDSDGVSWPLYKSGATDWVRLAVSDPIANTAWVKVDEEIWMLRLNSPVGYGSRSEYFVTADCSSTAFYVDNGSWSEDGLTQAWSDDMFGPKLFGVQVVEGSLYNSLADGVLKRANVTGASIPASAIRSWTTYTGACTTDVSQVEGTYRAVEYVDISLPIAFPFVGWSE